MPKLPIKPEINIGTAGHVDHGKTTMVEAITGVWTSAHSEELRRGITIKVGYADAAFYKCEDCSEPECYCTTPKCPKCGTESKLIRAVSFVDCPGHESLMANTLSGAALMDGSILVIAANEKVPQPQTREHLLALQMMGTKRIVVVQNKVDLLDDEEAVANYRAIRSFLDAAEIGIAPIVPISAQHKLNIDTLIQAIEQYIPTPDRDLSAKPLMQILRSFDINRPGMSPKTLKGGVVGGTLLHGQLTMGDDIELRPGILKEKSSKHTPITSTVESLETSAGLTDRVGPGGLLAVATKLDPFLTKGDALVGSVLGLPGELPPVLDNLTMETQLFETAVGAPDLAKVEKIRTGEPLRLNVGTAITLGLVSSVRDSLVEVNLKRPVCIGEGGRVAVSRRISDRWRLIGSGVIK